MLQYSRRWTRGTTGWRKYFWCLGDLNPLGPVRPRYKFLIQVFTSRSQKSINFFRRVDHQRPIRSRIKRVRVVRSLHVPHHRHSVLPPPRCRPSFAGSTGSSTKPEAFASAPSNRIRRPSHRWKHLLVPRTREYSPCPLGPPAERQTCSVFVTEREKNKLADCRLLCLFTKTAGKAKQTPSCQTRLKTTRFEMARLQERFCLVQNRAVADRFKSL